MKIPSPMETQAVAVLVEVRSAIRNGRLTHEMRDALGDCAEMLTVLAFELDRIDAMQTLERLSVVMGHGKLPWPPPQPGFAGSGRGEERP